MNAQQNTELPQARHSLRAVVGRIVRRVFGPDAPPAGYVIETDGKYFRWRNKTYASTIDRPSYRAACKTAWRAERDKQWSREREARNWRKVNSPNVRMSDGL